MTENDRIHAVRLSQTQFKTLEKFGQRLGITKGALSAIENGKRGVTEQMRKAVCREFNVNEHWLRTGEGEMYAPQPEDELRALAARYNVCREGIDLVRFVLSLEEETQRDILAKLKALRAAQEEAGPNKDIDERVEAYRAALEAGEDSFIRLYRTPAAAGLASPIEGEDYDRVPRDAKTPWNADFMVRIQGDSMEPYIKNGDTVYVQRDTTLVDMDVGIFFLDGDVYCKQICQDSYGNIYLLSANPKRQALNKTILRNSTSTFICFGKVLLPHRLPEPRYKWR